MMTVRSIVQVRCPTCRCDVLAEVRLVGRARRCECPWCGHKLRIPRRDAS
jgi:uncharacterized paraquat-inducible protein A